MAAVSVDAPQVLDRHPVTKLKDYVGAGGRVGLDVARQMQASAVTETVILAGLRGRGGAGFPTGRKWQTVAAATSRGKPTTTVVVNAAEGEPGTFKDRTLIRTNPYKILEGALIAATAIGARRVVIAIKGSFTGEARRLRSAIADITAAGWLDGVTIEIIEGPGAYLFGEETALLEVLDGRQPFPRIAPPFRRGIDLDPGSGRTSATIDLATGDENESPPVLVNNVETLANVPSIFERGTEWFRRMGTPESPGTILCTVTGDVLHHGVIEVEMGVPLSEVIDAVGISLASERSVLGVLSGVSNPMIPQHLLDTPLTYEDMAAAGLGLGSCGFIVFDDSRHPVAIAQGVSRFLGVESCGQCIPCKRDGLALAAELQRFADASGEQDEGSVEDLLSTVADGARCNLASQQATVVGSILAAFDTGAYEVNEPIEPVTIAALADIVQGRAVMDADQATKQPDWSHDETDSGAYPAALLGDTPVAAEHEGLPPPW